MELKGRGAVVSGGASGLGAATVEILVREGAHAVIVDLPGSPGERLASSVGSRATFLPGDVRDPDVVQQAIDMAVSAAGGLHVAVCCAGVSAHARIVGPEGPMALDAFRHVVDVNLVGSFNLLRLAAAQMAQQVPIGEERGVIVMTASSAAFEGQIGQAAYAASKGAVVSLTLCAARDLASSKIRVNTIAPGPFDTPLFARVRDDVRAALAEAVPHPRRLGRPEEYAELVRHIVENAMLNGETIRLDGAIRMPPR